MASSAVATDKISLKRLYVCCILLFGFDVLCYYSVASDVFDFKLKICIEWDVSLPCVLSTNHNISYLSNFPKFFLMALLTHLHILLVYAMLCSASIMLFVFSKYLCITSSNGSLCFQMSFYALFIFCLSSSVLTLLHIFRYILYLNIRFKHWFRYFSWSWVLVKSTMGFNCFPSAVPVIILLLLCVFMTCLILFKVYAPTCPISQYCQNYRKLGR